MNIYVVVTRAWDPHENKERTTAYGPYLTMTEAAACQRELHERWPEVEYHILPLQGSPLTVLG